MEQPEKERRFGVVWFWIGTIALAINLRVGVASLPPLLPEVGRRFALGTLGQSGLSSTPIVCFAIFSGLGLIVARRFGDERTLGAAVVVLACGLGLRGLSDRSVLFLGTAFMGAGVAFMNVLLSSLIKRREPRRAGTLVGTYLVALSTGSMAASGLAVPIAGTDGHALRFALGIGALPAAAALLLWSPQLTYRTRVPSLERVRVRDLARRRLAWHITAFMGLQSLCYYATLSWLPTLLQGRHVSATVAGLLTSLLSAGGMIGSFAWSWAAGRRDDHRGLIAPAMATCIVALIGVLWAPTAIAWLCVFTLGIGQGASLALPLYFMIARSSTPATAATLSSMAQGFGYLIASLGPLGVGLIHAETGSWRAGFSLVFAATAAEWIVADRAARPLVL